jgi:hypothetical protein
MKIEMFDGLPIVSFFLTYKGNLVELQKITSHRYQVMYKYLHIFGLLKLENLVLSHSLPP